MARIRAFSSIALALGLGLMAGCGRLQPADGVVKVDGVAVKDGMVWFHPVGGGRPASAKIMEDGSFVLCYEKPGDGLPVGDYKVVIVADVFKEGKKTKAQEMDEANMKRQGINDTSTLTGGVLIHLVPPEYNNLETTPLTQKVESASGSQHFVYDIATKKK